ncbi:DUF421 domain-containing protein [Rurimicrobium arvi]|uniref:DUF421 domain-containing protein n=2 Tax=Rurimicrobium arvi TaxID=2049916 RepID=A0ABP8MHS7_9BACT
MPESMISVAELWGTGKELEVHQVLLRCVAVFILVLICIRIAGRRSFGLKTPLDSIVTILLGALMSRAIVGSSPFVPVAASGILLAVLHRLFAMMMLSSPRMARMLNGTRICVYADGNFLTGNMRKALVREQDIMQGVRKTIGKESLEDVEKIYLERNGEFSIIKK